MSFQRVLAICGLIPIVFLAACGSDPAPTAAVVIARPDLQAAVRTASENGATIRHTAKGSGNAFAPVVLFEERHDLRAVQVQEAMSMVRMHDQYGMRDIALEGYLKDEGPIDTLWMKKASGSGGANGRARAVISLLREG